jgi:UDP-N-acetylmuramoyl-tripeptide--D-alanyl-D-alanine ligase
VQGDAAEIVEGAVAAGVPRERTKVFATPADAAEFLGGFVRPGDLLLVKGSRSVKMERIIEALLGRFVPEDARSRVGVEH